MKRIEVTNENTYRGQFEDWTEPLEREFVTKKDLVVSHKSFDLIEKFQVGVMTCINNEYDSNDYFNAPTRDYVIENYKVKKDTTHIARNDIDPEYLYKMIIPKGTRVMEFASGEYRFYMNHSVKIELIGIMGNIRIIDDSYDSRMYGGVDIKVFTEKF